ncbi:3'-5' exonuclease [Bradyrhizobium sp. RDM12]
MQLSSDRWGHHASRAASGRSVDAAGLHSAPRYDRARRPILDRRPGSNRRAEGINPDDGPAQARFSATLDRFVAELRVRYPAPPSTLTAAETLTAEILDFIGRDQLLAAHPAYAQGGWLEKIVKATTLHLQASTGSAKDWIDALDTYEGLHAVPLMTIHKSKGLEYHTVVFVGLDDDAWRRSFEEDRVEATSGFFVAFTRAKQGVVFTCCTQRGTRRAIASCISSC